MPVFSVTSGDIKYVSDKDTYYDAALEIIDKTFDGCFIGNEIAVVDMNTGNKEVFDTYDILSTLDFKWED